MRVVRHHRHHRNHGAVCRHGRRAQPGSARRPQRRLVRCRTGGLESPAGFDHTALGFFHQQEQPGRAALLELRLGVLGALRLSGELQRLSSLGHRRSEQAEARHLVLLSSVAKRRVGLPQPSICLRRGCIRTFGLRCAGSPRHGEQRARARHSHLRHHRRRAPQVPRQRANLPRLPHAHSGHRSKRRRECVRLHLGFSRRAVAQ